MIQEKTIAFIGLGAMGGRMAKNLVAAGYRVIGFDINQKALDSHVEAGGEAAENAADAVKKSDIILTSLVSHVNKMVMNESMIPNLREGQICIDHSTIPAPTARVFHEDCRKKGARYLEAPVSGWITGAERGTLTMYCGGEKSLFDEVYPVLEVMGNPERIMFCPGRGMGQVMKVVGQLQSRFVDLARLELLSFGAKSGLSMEMMLKVFGIDRKSNDRYAQLASQIENGEIAEKSSFFLFGEWGYYLEEADTANISMPMFRAIYDRCKKGEMVNKDEQGREGPDIWRELIR